MFDLRPVGYVVGLLVAVLGGIMLIPMVLDWWNGDPNAGAFFQAAVMTVLTGGLVALASSNGVKETLSIEQTFLLTTGVWLVLPIFGALPFVMGAPNVGFTDAYFEAMSGLTTTGSTVFVGLDEMPHGVLVWRAIMQWLGGLGIAVVAMVFLPAMRVGGMQFFRSEGFDALGKILPRALDIASALVQVYILMTILCVITYVVLGMDWFDAVSHAFTTVSTGGFSTSDQSFAKFSGAAEYAAVLFMIAASLPLIRFVQLMSGSAQPIIRDPQVRAYILMTFIAIFLVFAYRVVALEHGFEAALRESVFNVTSLFSGTGYTSADVTLWGPFPLVVFLIVGLIGGCTASTGCSVKVFRYLVLFSAIRAQIRRIQAPNGIFPIQLGGRKVDDDVLNSVMAFFVLFIVTLGVLAVLLSMTGLENGTAISAAWTAVANVGPAFGPEVSASGAMDQFPDSAKWLMIAGMLIGRLEILSVYVLFTVQFWRR